MTKDRTLVTAGRVDVRLLPKGPHGRALCRWCRRECPKAMQTFCGPECVHDHRVRSDPGYARACVLARDQGVCAVCRVDTLAVQADLLQRKPKERKLLAAKLGYPYPRIRKGTLWEMDHIRPVAHGGGSCGLDNLQTLCCRCHVRKSAAQAVTRARARTGVRPTP